MMNWLPMLQSAHDQACPVAITERKKWETHHAAHRIVALTAQRVTLDDHTQIPLRAITRVTVEAAQGGVSPFVGRVGHLRYTRPDQFPVGGGEQ